MTHYFETPTSDERRRTITARFWDADWDFTTAAGVDAGVRAPGDGQPGGLGQAQDGGDPVLERALHGAQPVLGCPAVEVPPVVGEVEPVAGGHSGTPPPASTRGVRWTRSPTVGTAAASDRA